MNELENQREFRKENFYFSILGKIDPLTKWQLLTLSISTNGYQSTSVSFTKEEWKKIKRALNRAFKELDSIGS